MALALFTGSAFGADLAVREAPAIEASATTPTWTGFYVGAHGALALGQTGISGLTSFGFPEYWDVNGAEIGIHAGFNYQIKTLVLGVEADYSYTRINGDASGRISYLVGTPFQFDMTSTVDIEFRRMAMLRPRIGMAADNFLIYVTAGIVAADMEERARVVFTSPFFGTESHSIRYRSFVYGWTAGAGLEQALSTKLSLKAEYLLVTLDRDERGELLEENLYQGHFFRIGLNYRF
jgi:outer membrane immunogenic protein